MASLIPSDCCTTGTIHHASLRGVEEEIHGLNTYVSRGGPTKGIIVIVPDPFGWQLPNVRLLADSISQGTSATVYVPDFMFGDSLSTEYLHLVHDPKGLSFIVKAKLLAQKAQVFGPWMFKHREGVSWPIINGFFEALYKDNPARKVCVAGYCWGGRYAVLLTHRERWMMSNGVYKEGGFVSAAFAAHPNFLSVPKEIAAIGRPVSFAVGEHDEMLPAKSVEKIKETLAEKKTVESEVRVYEGAMHEFALKGDMDKPVEKMQLEEAAKQAVDWFKKFL